MEEDLEQQKLSSNDTSGSISGPPAPKITIRTMDSDIKALEQGGGETIFPVEEPKTEVKLDIPGYVGPEKPIFVPTSPLRRSSSEASDISAEESPEKKINKWKIIGIIVGILIVIVGFGLLGYFIVSTWFFSKEMPAVQ